MSKTESELCPKCKKGHLRPIGKASTNVESDEPFSPAVHMRDLVCDSCGYTQKAASLTKYQLAIKFVQFISNVTYQILMSEKKAFTCHCGASFKTDQELHDHMREHID